MAACSAFVSFSVTMCLRAAAPSDGRPILRCGLRVALVARRFIVRGISRTSGYCIPESLAGQFGLTLLAADPEGGGLPRHVERELAAYLRCGILAHGFARVRCTACRDEIVVAPSRASHD